VDLLVLDHEEAELERRGPRALHERRAEVAHIVHGDRVAHEGELLAQLRLVLRAEPLLFFDRDRPARGQHRAEAEQRGRPAQRRHSLPSSMRSGRVFSRVAITARITDTTAVSNWTLSTIGMSRRSASETK